MRNPTGLAHCSLDVSKRERRFSEVTLCDSAALTILYRAHLWGNALSAAIVGSYDSAESVIGINLPLVPSSAMET